MYSILKYPEYAVKDIQHVIDIAVHFPKFKVKLN